MVSSWRSVLALIVFLTTNLTAIFPINVPIPLPTIIVALANRLLIYARIYPPSLAPLPHLLGTRNKSLSDSLNGSDDDHSPGPGLRLTWFKFPIDHQTGPVIAVVFLAVTTVLHGSDIRKGVVGADGIEPISIMALFISLAYMTISLDAAGLFKFLAFKVAEKGGASGRRLYLYLYIFFFASGVAVGNDPVVLFGTPFLVYFSQVTGINPPTAWIFAQFSTANMASGVFPPSNLTNLVLVGAFSINFISYMAYLILPVLASAAAVFPILSYALFRSDKLIPRRIDVVALHELFEQQTDSNTPSVQLQEASEEKALKTEGDPERGGATIASAAAAPTTVTARRRTGSILKDKQGAWFGSVVLLAALATLVGTSTLKIQVWYVAVPAAVLVLARDAYHDISRWTNTTSPAPRVDNKLPRDQDIDSRMASLADRANPLNRQTLNEPMTLMQAGTDPVQREMRTEVLPIGLKGEGEKEQPVHPKGTVYSFCSYLKRERFPTVLTVVLRLPVSLVIFSFCMFTLVQVLTSQGWVSVFAGWWSAWMRACTKGGEASAVVGAISMMFLISVVLCNICGTNIGANILLSRVLQVWLQGTQNVGGTEVIAIPGGARLGSIYALALGTNYGAFSFSFTASLAGLLWHDILLQKRVIVRQSQFALLNLPVIAVAVAVAIGVLVAEMYVVRPQ